MQMCMDHWNRLKARIEELGMSAFIADSGDELMRKVDRTIEEGETPDSFDPLMNAHMAIIYNLAAMMGPFILGIEGCPICYANMAHDEGPYKCEDPKCGKTKPFDMYIEHAATEQLEYFKELSDQ